MRERIKSPPSDVVISYITRPNLEADKQDTFYSLMQLNKAHVVMLAQRGIVLPENAAQLLRVLEDVCRAGADSITWDPVLEDVYFNLEAHIIERVGPAIGGQMHTARSRNDLLAARTRMFTRDRMLSIATYLANLRKALLDLAVRHAETIVTGYTHMQPAQPTTLGHYFHAIAQALERDDRRLQQSYEVVNCSPLGACAFNATGFPIDRHMLAELTGFSGLVENSIDSVAARDYVPQVLGTLANIGITLSRLAQDLYIWATDEFGWLEVGDDVASTSSIMPQKKNPMTLEHIRGKSAHLIGALVAALSAQKGTPYGHTRDVSLESTHCLGEGFRQAEMVINLAAVTLPSLKVRSAVAAGKAADNFSTVTELADVLVREAGFTFRDAHGVIGAAVQELVNRGGKTSDVTLELLDRLSQERVGRQIGLSATSLQRALKPMENVLIRAITGGPAPDEVRRSVTESRKRLTQQEEWWGEQSEKLKRSREQLHAAVEKLVTPRAKESETLGTSGATR